MNKNSYIFAIFLPYALSICAPTHSMNIPTSSTAASIPSLAQHLLQQITLLKEDSDDVFIRRINGMVGNKTTLQSNGLTSGTENIIRLWNLADHTPTSNTLTRLNQRACWHNTQEPAITPHAQKLLSTLIFFSACPLSSNGETPSISKPIIKTTKDLLPLICENTITGMIQHVPSVYQAILDTASADTTDRSIISDSMLYSVLVNIDHTKTLETLKSNPVLCLLSADNHGKERHPAIAFFWYRLLEVMRWRTQVKH